MIAWAATPNASFASFWSSSRKSINFWFAGLKASRWNSCFAVAIDWSFTYFLRNTVKICATFSLIGLVMFLKVCSASPCMREWKYFIWSSSVSWLFIFKRVWSRSSINLNFFDFASKVGIVVVRDLGDFEILLMLLLLKLAEILFVAICWRANRNCSASIAAGVFSMGNCDWLVERAFLCFPDEVPGEQ